MKCGILGDTTFIYETLKLEMFRSERHFELMLTVE